MIFKDVSAISKPILYVHKLAVDLQWQRQRIGAYLISQIYRDTIDISERAGIRAIQLQALPETVEFYEKRGFLTYTVPDDDCPSAMIEMCLISVRDIRRGLVN